MFLRRLNLTSFRSYESLQWDIPYRICCLTGRNGVGKTNILEAIKFLCATRGFSTDKNALRAGDSFFMIEGHFHPERGEEFSVQCNYMERKGKKILLDGDPLPKMSLHLGKIPLTVVLPSDTELILGGGTERRAWLDALISQFNADYLNALIAYEKALTQRNALLQSFLEHHTFDGQQLEPWTLQLAEKGSLIARGRLQFLADFRPQFVSFYQKMISEGETPSLQYETAWEQNQEPTTETFLTFLQKNIARDRASGRTQAGIHRDDLAFLLNERSVRYYGSQGQQKTFVTALQLAQYDFLQKQTGKTPILLLDDVFDKLDEHRVKHIVHRLTHDTGGQVFLTDSSLARLKHLFPEEKSDIWGFYRIENGLLFPA